MRYVHVKFRALALTAVVEFPRRYEHDCVVGVSKEFRVARPMLGTLVIKLGLHPRKVSVAELVLDVDGKVSMVINVLEDHEDVCLAVPDDLLRLPGRLVINRMSLSAPGIIGAGMPVNSIPPAEFCPIQEPSGKSGGFLESLLNIVIELLFRDG